MVSRTVQCDATLCRERICLPCSAPTLCCQSWGRGVADAWRLPQSEDAFAAAKWRTAEQGALWLNAAFVRVTIYERRDGWTFSLFHTRRRKVWSPRLGRSRVRIDSPQDVR